PRDPRDPARESTRREAGDFRGEDGLRPSGDPRPAVDERAARARRGHDREALLFCKLGLDDEPADLEAIERRRVGEIGAGRESLAWRATATLTLTSAAAKIAKTRRGARTATSGIPRRRSGKIAARTCASSETRSFPASLAPASSGRAATARFPTRSRSGPRRT